MGIFTQLIRLPAAERFEKLMQLAREREITSSRSPHRLFQGPGGLDGCPRGLTDDLSAVDYQGPSKSLVGAASIRPDVGRPRFLRRRLFAVIGSKYRYRRRT